MIISPHLSYIASHWRNSVSNSGGLPWWYGGVLMKFWGLQICNTLATLHLKFWGVATPYLPPPRSYAHVACVKDVLDSVSCDAVINRYAHYMSPCRGNKTFKSTLTGLQVCCVCLQHAAFCCHLIRSLAWLLDYICNECNSMTNLPRTCYQPTNCHD
jgi:hypothetical protein